MTESYRETYQRDGHVTVEGVFSAAAIDGALRDVAAWGEAVLDALTPDERAWYVDHEASGQPKLRKLDQPVYERTVLRLLAFEGSLIALVADLMGPPNSIPFSQIFMKPPEGGGPKPMHQDNFYFGPSKDDGLIAAWIALDDATEENGCLEFIDGSHLQGVIPHEAPVDEPFNLQISAAILTGRTRSTAPVSRGGVSFHHGTTIHGSARNMTNGWRRAIAVHYQRADVTLTHPALEYDTTKFVALP